MSAVKVPYASARPDPQETNRLRRVLVAVVLLTASFGLWPDVAAARSGASITPSFGQYEEIDGSGDWSRLEVESDVSEDASVFPDDDGTPEGREASSSDREGSTNGLIVGIVMLGVFVVGLRAIKRQRDEGRRSKLPPIG